MDLLLLGGRGLRVETSVGLLMEQTGADIDETIIMEAETTRGEAVAIHRILMPVLSDTIEGIARQVATIEEEIDAPLTGMMTGTLSALLVDALDIQVIVIGIARAVAQPVLTMIRMLLTEAGILLRPRNMDIHLRPRTAMEVTRTFKREKIALD